MSPTIAKYSSLKESAKESVSERSKEDAAPKIDVEREMAAANAYSSSGYKGYFPSPYSVTGRQSVLSPSAKVSDARDKVKSRLRTFDNICSRSAPL